MRRGTPAGERWKRVGSLLLWPCFLVILLGLFLFLLNSRYPLIGHDYDILFLPRLLAGKWHILTQGLRPFWYTPLLGGGFPMYGNPEDLSYSLLQFLCVVLDPWRALQLTFVITLTLGYVGWWLFARDIVRLRGHWTHLLALVISANGFYLMHMAVGHVSYHTFPLIGWMYWLLLSRSPDTRASLLQKAAGFALAVAWSFYGGGYFVLIEAMMGFALLLPLELSLCGIHLGKRLRILGPRLLACTVAAVLLTASKLVAVWSLMRFFPRTAGFPHMDSWAALSSILNQFWAWPQLGSLYAGLPYGPHEYAMMLSPVTLFGLIAGIVIIAFEWGKSAVLPRRMVLLSYYLLALGCFFLDFQQGGGSIVTQGLHFFPFTSLRVASRFQYLLSLLLCVGGVYGLRMAVLRWSPSSERITAVCGGIVTLAFFLLAQWQMMDDLGFTANYQDRLKSMAFVRPGAAAVAIAGIKDEADFNGNAGIAPHDPLLDGPSTLHAGNVLDKTDGAYNMLNPSCFAYPDENHCKAYDRITDPEDLERFRNGWTLRWKVSRLQSVSDCVSLVALFACLYCLLRDPVCTLIGRGVKKPRRFPWIPHWPINHR